MSLVTRHSSLVKNLCLATSLTSGQWQVTSNISTIGRNRPNPLVYGCGVWITVKFTHFRPPLSGQGESAMKFALLSFVLFAMACTTFGCHASGGVDVDKSAAQISVPR
jgi:hypothetical protein